MPTAGAGVVRYGKSLCRTRGTSLIGFSNFHFMRIIRIRAIIRAFQTRLVFIYNYALRVTRCSLCTVAVAVSVLVSGDCGLYICYTQFIMFKGAMCIHHQSMVCMICDSLHAASVSVSITVSVSVLQHDMGE